MAGSLLESFYLAITLDNEGLTKGASETKSTTDNLSNSLKKTDVIAQHLTDSFTGLIRRYGAVIAQAVSLGAILNRVNSAANYADNLNDISKSLQVNVESLSAWGDAVKLTGGSAEQFQGTVHSLHESLSEFAITGQGKIAPFLRSIGVNAQDAAGKVKDIFTLLPEIAGAFEKLDNNRALRIGRGIGLDDATIRLLQKGTTEVDRIIRRQKELGAVTAEDAIIAGKFNDAWDDTAHAFRGLFTEVGSNVLPVFTSLLNGTQDFVVFLKGNSDFVTGFVITLTTLLTLKLIPALIRVGIAMVTAFAPIYAAAAAILAIATAIGFISADIAKYNRGEESITGTIIDPSNEKTKSYLEHHSDNPISFGLTPQQQLLGQYKTPEGNAEPEATSNYENLFKGKRAIQFASSSPIASQSSNSIVTSNNNASNRSTSVSVGAVNVHTQATDAKGVAGGVSNALNEQIRQAASTYDDGMLA